MAAKFFTGLPLDGPDPECVKGHGEALLQKVPEGAAPSAGPGHSVPVRLGVRRRPVELAHVTDLGALAWPDVAARASTTLLALPLGSTEQHGPHLPLATDTEIAVALAGRLAEVRSEVVVAPAARLRFQRRARRLPRHPLDRAGRLGAGPGRADPLGRRLRRGADRVRPWRQRRLGAPGGRSAHGRGAPGAGVEPASAGRRPTPTPATPKPR